VTKKIVKKSVLNQSALKKKSTAKTSGRMSVGAKAPKKAESRKSAKLRPPKGPIWQWSALEKAAAIRSGAISSVEVIDAHIERMRAVNHWPI
jgi:amidase